MRISAHEGMGQCLMSPLSTLFCETVPLTEPFLADWFPYSAFEDNARKCHLEIFPF